MSEPLTDNQIEIRRKALTEPWNSNGSIGERELSYIATIDDLKAEIERLKFKTVRAACEICGKLTVTPAISFVDERCLRKLRAEIDRLTRERDAAEAVGAQQETDGIVHTLRSMAKNLKPEFAQMMNVAADAFEKFPRPKSSALEQVKAQARLEEIKAFDCDSIFTSENKRKRIAALEAAAGRKS